MIIESGIVAATTADLLSGGRLNTIPYAGQLTLQLSANLADATNQYTLTIQKPDGSVPIDGQLLSGEPNGATGILDSRSWLELNFTAAVGGHFQITLTETGTAVAIWRAILRP